MMILGERAKLNVQVILLLSCIICCNLLCEARSTGWRGKLAFMPLPQTASTSDCLPSSRHIDQMQQQILFRGGGGNEEEEEAGSDKEEEESVEEEEDTDVGSDVEEEDNDTAVTGGSTDAVGAILKVSQQVVSLAGKILLRAAKAAKCAVGAAIQETKDSSDTESSATTKVLNALKSMWTAAIDSLKESGEASSNSSDTESSEDNDVAVADGSTDAVGAILKVSKQVASFVGKILLRTAKATKCAVGAAIQETKDSSDTESSTTTKVLDVLKSMWTAAMDSLKESGEASSAKIKDKTSEKSDEEPSSADTSDVPVDNGSFLSESYGGIESSRDELDSPSPILGGTLSDALKIARSKARLLVVFIPSAPPGKGTESQEADNKQAIGVFLSSDLSNAAEKRARKKEETGSFVLWTAEAGSSEAAAAIKRLKAQQTNTKGVKRPILLAVYPSQVVSKTTGAPALVPKLLAQHHCTPPPSPSKMAAWLNALRKRHAKQYAAMQLELREAQLLQERKAGYKGSMKSDKAREVKEQKAEEERAAKEKAEAERREALEQRRKDLEASLPKEPGRLVMGSKTVSIRHNDGRSAQRRFAGDTAISTLFDWVDVSFEIERETVILTTLNGQKTFSWDDDDNDENTLEKSGLGRMVGLRVTTKENDEPVENTTAATES